ncbi:hypothetical protein C8R42DRAFT_723297 [Lentinula raphanica]|nr:hypothetical protein C8R42DRAFT_723297 [Lentinula raphanica]
MFSNNGPYTKNTNPPLSGSFTANSNVNVTGSGVLQLPPITSIGVGMGPMSAPGPSTSRAINPADIPLPQDGENDFPPANKILPKVVCPALKVAGARRVDTKGKGKAKALEDDEGSNRKRKRG